MTRPLITALFALPLVLGGCTHPTGGTDEPPLDDTSQPADDTDTGVGSLSRSVFAPTRSCCVVLEEGQVRCWGNNTNGKLGYGDNLVIGDDETPAEAGDRDRGWKNAHLCAAG